MPAYWKQGDEWIRRTGRRSGRPVGPWRSRRLDRQQAKVAAVPSPWTPPDDRDDSGGTAGVRVPRVPQGPLPTLAAEVELPA